MAVAILNWRDRSLHTVCCEVTREFLDFALSRGNDLITPNFPQFNFPGLKPGDRWCVYTDLAGRI